MRGRRLAVAAAAATVLAATVWLVGVRAHQAFLAHVRQERLDRDLLNQFSGRTISLQAARQPLAGRLQRLLARGADPNARLGMRPARGWLGYLSGLMHRDATGPCALALAISSMDPAAVAVLAERGANVNSLGPGQGTPIEAAAFRDDESTVWVLLQHGARVRKSQMVSPFMQRGRVYRQVRLPILVWAAHRNSERIAHVLLDLGADPNCRDTTGDSALHVASAHGDAAVTSLLLARGAGVALRNSQGRTPLSESRPNSECARLLRQAGARE